MATTAEQLYFTYNGISCKQYNLMNTFVNISSSRKNTSGMYRDSLVATRTINETALKGNDTPLFSNIDETPLEFDMDLVFTQAWTDESIDDIVVWLFQDNYKPLYFDNNPNKIYYCMPNGTADLVHTGAQQGFFTITMRCKSSKVYSPTQLTTTVDLSTSTTTYNATINNSGHVSIYPEISFKKVGAGKIIFTKNGQIFEIDNLVDGEDIYINCEKEIIETDAIGIYHYSDVVGDYFDMELQRGDNTISVDGTCTNLQFRYVLKYKF